MIDSIKENISFQLNLKICTKNPIKSSYSNAENKSSTSWKKLQNMKKNFSSSLFSNNSNIDSDDDQD